jgi:glycosyltransferase involved in cell wall biosynthesis
MNCCICGPIKNCGPFLDKVFENIEKIGLIFDNYEIIVFYDKSCDNTLQKIIKYGKKNPKFKYYINKNPVSPYRTHNIAKGRNYCLEYIKKNKTKFPFFIMMDFDDVNCKNCNPEIIKKYLKRNDWDGLSFNTSPKYYDIWGLSIYPFCFSYNHFHKNPRTHFIIQDYVVELLKKLKPNKLLPCISSFNGFSIYRTDKFLDTYYDGRVRLDLIPPENMKAHMDITGSKLTFNKFKTLDAKYEDCEHRAFHILATKNSGARIMISPEIVFTG